MATIYIYILFWFVFLANGSLFCLSCLIIFVWAFAIFTHLYCLALYFLLAKFDPCVQCRYFNMKKKSLKKLAAWCRCWTLQSPRPQEPNWLTYYLWRHHAPCSSRNARWRQLCLGTGRAVIDLRAACAVLLVSIWQKPKLIWDKWTFTIPPISRMVVNMGCTCLTLWELEYMAGYADLTLSSCQWGLQCSMW